MLKAIPANGRSTCGHSPFLHAFADKALPKADSHPQYATRGIVPIIYQPLSPYL
jgi:hypothetical protein